MNSCFGYGLIGEKLRHSLSPQIHEMLSPEPYSLIEIKRNALENFLKKGEFAGINVTIPYKKDVMTYLDQVSEIAEKIGAVNTIVNIDGKLTGYNTDYHGLLSLIEKNQIHIRRKKVLILGSGGTANTATAVSEHLGAESIVKVSRKKKNGFATYDEALSKHKDSQILINTTPVGMHPNNDDTPIDISNFDKLEAVVDVIYNPLRTKLVVQALEKGIKACGGLYMLVSQAAASGELFYDKISSTEDVDRIYDKLLWEKENIVFSGMPGCGKTTFAKGLSREMQRPFVDTDCLIREKTGMTIEQLFIEKGEDFFRDKESEVVKDICSEMGKIIALGGGTVLRKENVMRLKQNGKIYFLNKRLQDIFLQKGRPLAKDQQAMEKLYETRCSVYKSTADTMIRLGTHKKENCDIIKRTLGIRDEITESKMKLMVINGPNINMIGVRQPEIYGRETYEDLRRMIENHCKAKDVDVEIFQSNHEGAIIDKIQESLGVAQGIIINPGGYTHTSIAIPDAIQAVDIPAVEVHITDIYSREDFRKKSYVSPVVVKTICGKGLRGYIEAIDYLTEHLGFQRSND